MSESVLPDNTHEALARGLFGAFENERPRLERSEDLNVILKRLGVEAPTYEDIAAVTRWADAHVSAGLDAVLAWLVAEGWSKTEPDQWEWGIEYEVTSTRSVYIAARSEKQARKEVERSPTDTGLRRRRPAGDWKVIPDAG
jgi:hypothetical protein